MKKFRNLHSKIFLSIMGAFLIYISAIYWYITVIPILAIFTAFLISFLIYALVTPLNEISVKYMLNTDLTFEFSLAVFLVFFSLLFIFGTPMEDNKKQGYEIVRQEVTEYFNESKNE